MKAVRENLKALKTLTERADFVKIQSSGQKWISQGLILQVRENDSDAIRVGFTVSKKVHKSAVKRNRIKRRLRAVASDILSVHGKMGCDYVLVGREATATRAYSILLSDLSWCMKKTGFYKSGQEN